MGKIKRSEVWTFLNVTPDSTATYAQLNDGITTGNHVWKINYNPKTSEDHYIGNDNASPAVEGYAPELPIEQTAIAGDDVFDFIDGLRRERAVLDDAETDILNVWGYETPSGTSYPAEKQDVCIAIEDFGGDGGEAAKINYTIKFIGDPVAGTYDTATGEFTES
jgi:hypothetical protein